MDQQARRTNGSSIGYDQPAAGLDRMLALNQPAIQAMTEINGRMFEHMAALNSEWMGFLQRSWQESLSLPQQLSQCRTPQDAMRVYGDFMQHSMQNYQSEMAKLTKIGQAMTSETAGIVREKVEETTRSMRS